MTRPILIQTQEAKTDEQLAAHAARGGTVRRDPAIRRRRRSPRRGRGSGGEGRR
jgi:hypothetical protein